ncbi:MAG: hypothetical protein IKP76_01565 [Bacilli bacterium]|nr:hypothetical protein [Bacilli bacterium]
MEGKIYRIGKPGINLGNERMVIVEGPQGAGKSTLANYLRDNIPGANLYRLSGQKDKTLTGLEHSRKMYDALFEYLTKMQSVPMDMIFDRTFTTEEVYSRLGYKDYSFTEDYEAYLKMLERLNYDIYYFSLYLRDIELYKQRLDRGGHHNYQSFSVDNSRNQQETFLEISHDLSELKNVNAIQLPMDDFDEAYDIVKDTLKIR